MPVPGLATHLDSHALSPTIDWPALIRAQKERIGAAEAREGAADPVVEAWT